MKISIHIGLVTLRVLTNKCLSHSPNECSDDMSKNKKNQTIKYKLTNKQTKAERKRTPQMTLYEMFVIYPLHT